VPNEKAEMNSESEGGCWRNFCGGGCMAWVIYPGGFLLSLVCKLYHLVECWA